MQSFAFFPAQPTLDHPMRDRLSAEVQRAVFAQTSPSSTLGIEPGSVGTLASSNSVEPLSHDNHALLPASQAEPAAEREAEVAELAAKGGQFVEKAEPGGDRKSVV